MSMCLEEIVVSVLLAICGVMLLGVIFITVLEYQAEGKCLEAGYPKAKVRLNGDAYCLGLDGSTHTAVEKI